MMEGTISLSSTELLRSASEVDHMVHKLDLFIAMHVREFE